MGFKTSFAVYEQQYSDPQMLSFYISLFPAYSLSFHWKQMPFLLINSPKHFTLHEKTVSFLVTHLKGQWLEIWDFFLLSQLLCFFSWKRKKPASNTKNCSDLSNVILTVILLSLTVPTLHKQTWLWSPWTFLWWDNDLD